MSTFIFNFCEKRAVRHKKKESLSPPPRSIFSLTQSFNRTPCFVFPFIFRFLEYLTAKYTMIIFICWLITSRAKQGSRTDCQTRQHNYTQIQFLSALIYHQSFIITSFNLFLYRFNRYSPQLANLNRRILSYLIHASTVRTDTLNILATCLVE